MGRICVAGFTPANEPAAAMFNYSTFWNPVFMVTRVPMTLPWT